MKSPEQTQLIQDFARSASWEERYQKIIAMGKALPVLPEEYKTEDLRVKGCQSQVWLKADIGSDGRVRFQADSDALIVKGLIAILLKIYSGKTPAEILEISPDFISELGFSTNLSPSRANGLVSMIKQVKYYALAFQAQKRD